MPGRWLGSWGSSGMIPAFRQTDDFSDGVVDTRQWEQFAFGSVIGAEIPDFYVFTVDTSGSGGASLFTRSRHSISGDNWTVELVDAGAQEAGLQAYPVEFQVDANNRIFINVSNGFIGCWQTVAGVSTDHGFTAYNPAVHRWFRLSEDAGVTSWEVSTDGAMWTTLASVANPIPTDDVTLLFATDTFLALSEIKTVVVGHVGAP